MTYNQRDSLWGREHGREQQELGEKPGAPRRQRDTSSARRCEEPCSGSRVG